MFAPHLMLSQVRLTAVTPNSRLTMGFIGRARVPRPADGCAEKENIVGPVSAMSLDFRVICFFLVSEAQITYS